MLKAKCTNITSTNKQFSWTRMIDIVDTKDK